MNKGFREAYKALNAKQREAVEAIDGPVMVIAGPGTGKTQLLSMRVANLLKKTDAKPSNILALTFTNKAAVNMKDRIMALAGREGARVPASTFHSFAAEIMNLYPDNFWKAARLSVAPDSVQLDIIEQIVAQLPLDNRLAQKFAGQYTLLKDIKDALKLAKEAGLTPDKLRAIVNLNLAYIEEIEQPLAKLLEPRLSAAKLPALAAEVESLSPQTVPVDMTPLVPLTDELNRSLAEAIEADADTGKTANTGKWKIKWIQSIEGKRGMFKERDRNQWWLELADVYEAYRDELHQRLYYDYSDMLVEVLAQLDSNPEMLADVQERFSYVLVDEFQDSTPAQIRLAHLIADHFTAEGRPNLMVVGDDDQTIYKFNGAEVNNMLQFEQRYPDVKKVVLTDNYRSSQPILDFAKQVIEEAEVRLVKIDKSLKKELRAQSSELRKGSIRTLAYSSSELELSSIARDIKKQVDSRFRGNDGGGGESIAVLARGHENLVKLAGLLQQLEVPVRYEQSSDILEHPIIKQTYLMANLMLAIQAGDKQTINELIHQILRWPAWGLEARQLWELATDNFRAPNWLDSLLKSKNQKLKSMGEWFIDLAQIADSQPLAVTIEQILGLLPTGQFQSPVRNYYLAKTGDQTNEYFHGLSAIQLLRNMVYEFGAERQPALADLVRYYDINHANQIVVADESPFVTGQQAVELLTVHKAKGLEFHDVYIIDAVEDRWKPRSGGRKPPANLPLQAHGDDMDDYIRLMYVAITRAEANLTISGYHQNHSGREVALSSIIQPIKAFETVEQPSQPELVEVLEENLRWPELKAGDEQAILKARLEGYNLNVSQLINFLDVERGGPAFFKERHLLLLPEVKEPSASFGTAIHAAMKLAQIQANRGDLKVPALVKEFETALRQEQLVPAEHKRRLSEGKRLLTKLFEDYKYQLPKGSLAEYELRNIRFGQASLSGTLDRVERGEETVMVADYKTGRPLNSFETRDQKEMVRAYKHKLQLIFYALLLEAQGESKPVSGEMVYVEADKPAALSRKYTPTAEDRAYLAELIEAVWEKIQKLDLPDVSGYSPDLAGIKAFEQDLLDGKI